MSYGDKLGKSNNKGVAMDFIETPIKKPVIRVGKDIKKMSNKSTTKSEAPAKVYNKTKGEHFKDIVIAILITAVIAFIGGMHFSNTQHAQVEQAVKNAQAVVPADTAKK